MPLHRRRQGAARLAQPWREAVLTQPLEAFTDRTLTGPEWLRKELAKTTIRGYSTEDREFQPDTRGLGAPVLNPSREAIAAIAVVAPVSRLPAERHNDVGQAVIQTAERLSADLM